MKKDLFIFLIIIVVIIGGFKLLSKKPSSMNNFNSSKATDMVLFWGDGCPHCENVKNYIKGDTAASKLNIDMKEVYYDKANQTFMEQVAAKCPELDISKGLAVPMAYAENKCLVGDTPIIDYLKSKTSTR